MIERREFLGAWTSAIENFVGSSCEITQVGLVAGGSINDACKIVCSQGNYFAKINDANSLEGMFEAEAKGLDFLRENSSFEVPTVIDCGISSGQQWILMEYIEGGVHCSGYWQTFGQRVAQMHRNSNEKFGLGHNNYLGSLRQNNEEKDRWADFFLEKRLLPQLKMARDQGRINEDISRSFDRLMPKIDDFFPKEAPSALHGDLWTGNFMTTKSGEATIFDPAVYYGHREMDLGMSKLFGGFDPDFYHAYHEEYPLESGWEDRIEVANLYPLLAHVNLFGASYVAQVRSILRKHT